MLYPINAQLWTTVLTPAQCNREVVFSAGNPDQTSLIYIAFGTEHDVMLCLWQDGTTIARIDIPPSTLVTAMCFGGSHELAVYVNRLGGECMP